MVSNSLEGSLPFSWMYTFGVELPISPTFEPIHRSSRPPPPERYSCTLCGKRFTRRQEVRRHYRDAHEAPLECLYCDFKWIRYDRYKRHLKKRHPDVDPDAVRGQGSIRKLCMYCDAEWNLSYQYKDHLRVRHPNVDPDAVLGVAPGSQRNDKIIARHYEAPVDDQVYRVVAGS